MVPWYGLMINGRPPLLGDTNSSYSPPPWAQSSPRRSFPKQISRSLSMGPWVVQLTEISQSSLGMIPFYKPACLRSAKHQWTDMSHFWCHQCTMINPHWWQTVGPCNDHHPSHVDLQWISGYQPLDIIWGRWSSRFVFFDLENDSHGNTMTRQLSLSASVSCTMLHCLPLPVGLFDPEFRWCCIWQRLHGRKLRFRAMSSIYSPALRG